MESLAFLSLLLFCITVVFKITNLVGNHAIDDVGVRGFVFCNYRSNNSTHGHTGMARRYSTLPSSPARLDDNLSHKPDQWPCCAIRFEISPLPHPPPFGINLIKHVHCNFTFSFFLASKIMRFFGYDHIVKEN